CPGHPRLHFLPNTWMRGTPARLRASSTRFCPRMTDSRIAYSSFEVLLASAHPHKFREDCNDTPARDRLGRPCFLRLLRLPAKIRSLAARAPLYQRGGRDCRLDGDNWHHACSAADAR